MKTKWILPLGLLLGMVTSCTKEEPTPKPLEQEEEVEQINTEIKFCSTIEFTTKIPNRYEVIIASSKGDYTYLQYTSEPFVKCLDVPINEPISIHITYDDNCRIRREFSQVYGPYPPNPSNIDIALTLDNSGDNTYHIIAGTALNCEKEPMENGLAIINAGGIQLAKEIAQGRFDYQFYNCNGGDQLTVKTIDFGTRMISDEVTYPLLEGSNEIESMTPCTPLHEFITYQVGGSPIITYENVEFSARVDPSGTESHIRYQDLFDFRWGKILGLDFGEDSNGHFTGPNSHGSANRVNGFYDYYYHLIGTVGDFIILSFNANYYFNDGAPHNVPIKVVMCVKRDP